LYEIEKTQNSVKKLWTIFEHADKLDAGNIFKEKLKHQHMEHKEDLMRISIEQMKTNLEELLN